LETPAEERIAMTPLLSAWLAGRRMVFSVGAAQENRAAFWESNESGGAGGGVFPAADQRRELSGEGRWWRGFGVLGLLGVPAAQ